MAGVAAWVAGEDRGARWHHADDGDT
jgi:hypothetical protein